jgi:hypothetical protein
LRASKNSSGIMGRISIPNEMRKYSLKSRRYALARQGRRPCEQVRILPGLWEGYQFRMK